VGRLDGQTAIVTGSVRGIGLGIARRVAADRCRIVVWDRTQRSSIQPAPGSRPRWSCRSISPTHVHHGFHVRSVRWPRHLL